MIEFKDVTAIIDAIDPLTEIKASDLETRCNLQFQNPNGLGEIEIEFDYSVPTAELVLINSNLPVADKNAALQAASLIVLSAETAAVDPVEEILPPNDALP